MEYRWTSLQGHRGPILTSVSHKRVPAKPGCPAASRQFEDRARIVVPPGAGGLIKLEIAAVTGVRHREPVLNQQ